ncbi:hypothetical protein A1F99_036360 [Pyrenophora tritici-repentis]|nr:hypothetical protein A1F99_036360 [Pyrenophora tritici-repentis]KAI0589995.1 hypothetical protein Alg215_00118 [Pyrenophora tritici-repentis]KAI1553531.1 hypothetical protein PtrSN001C_000126 [Pyrenophora tritici-repentis]KAI1575953.1 hypothetical protein PtrEW7m1_006394 [Pyrenophora tritici-repentis]KAI1579320.1 hypothetical protein PtrEW4_000563 [Pyrenophora tritici-repentis]
MYDELRYYRCVCFNPLDVNTWKMRNSRGVGGASGLESWEDFSPEAQEGRTMDKT